VFGHIAYQCISLTHREYYMRPCSLIPIILGLLLGTSPALSRAGVIASFTASPNASRPLQPVFFDGRSSYTTSPIQSIVGYSWNFGDGSPDASGAIAFHSFSSIGEYFVTLTATSDSSETNSLTLSHLVFNNAPFADAGGPYTVEVGASLHLDGSLSSDPDLSFGDYLSYEWDIGNTGTFDTLGISPSLPYSAFSGFGSSFSVALRVTDRFGAISQDMALVTVVEPMQSVPEPSSLVIFGIGMACTAVGAAVRRRKH
jgi:hypothetical protein